jgi:mannose-6-phosphate isomerase-like protein (cupin superfamily)
VLARGEEVRHTHKVPTVAILISGEIAAGQGTQRSAGDCIFVPAGEPHEFAATNPGQARIIEVEIR